MLLYLTQGAKLKSDKPTQWAFLEGKNTVRRSALTFQSREKCGIVMVNGNILRQQAALDRRDRNVKLWIVGMLPDISSPRSQSCSQSDGVHRKKPTGNPKIDLKHQVQQRVVRKDILSRIKYISIIIQRSDPATRPFELMGPVGE